jgi:hypothetical protein
MKRGSDVIVINCSLDPAAPPFERYHVAIWYENENK